MTPTFPAEAIGCSRDCTFHVAGIGYQCETCDAYIHPGDPGFKELKAYMDLINKIAKSRTDLERSAHILQAIVESINLDKLTELRDIRDKNQNTTTGDGSFDMESWVDLRTVLGYLTRFRTEALEFIKANG